MHHAALPRPFHLHGCSSSSVSASRLSAQPLPSAAFGSGAPASRRALTASASAALPRARDGPGRTTALEPNDLGSSSSGFVGSSGKGRSRAGVGKRRAAPRPAAALGGSSQDQEGAAGAAAEEDDDFFSDDDADMARALARPSSPSSDVMNPMELVPESGKCVGCGIELQCEDVNTPGFFKVPERLLKKRSPIPPGVVAIEADSPLLESPAARKEAEERGLIKQAAGGRAGVKEGFEKDVADWLEDPNRTEYRAPSPGAPSSSPLSASEVRRLMLEDKTPILCARCYALRHSGKVKDDRMEKSLPGFDLIRSVGTYLSSPVPGRSNVLVVVVDATDFDGSLPRQAVRALWPTSDKPSVSGRDRESRAPPPSTYNGARLVLVVNKVDLLPEYVSPKRLQEWVRRRVRQGGIPEPAEVHLVSAQEGRGIPALLESLGKLALPRGNIFVVGAQNAGKSTLLNAMRSNKGLAANLTIAALPGTTLGLVKVNEVFPHYIRLFDTPGVPHPYQLSARLSPEEVRMLLPRKPLSPRTFAMLKNQTLHVGGLVRVDVKATPGTGPIYVTLWASADVCCFWGSTEGAVAFYEQHVGKELTPPVGRAARAEHLGEMIASEVVVEGATWKESSVDVAIAGLGWLAVAVMGKAQLEVWAHDGVAVTTHGALIPDLAKDWERPGFDRSAKMLASTKRREEDKKEKREKREEKASQRKAKQALRLGAGSPGGAEAGSDGSGSASAQ